MNTEEDSRVVIPGLMPGITDTNKVKEEWKTTEAHCVHQETNKPDAQTKDPKEFRH